MDARCASGAGDLPAFGVVLPVTAAHGQTEIHRLRAAVVPRCGYDVDQLFAHYREQLARRTAEGWRVVPVGGQAEHPTRLATCEEPPGAEGRVR